MIENREQDLSPKQRETMHLTAFGKGQFILLFFLVIFWQARAQENSPRVTLQETNVSLKKIFNDISRQTGFSVMYDEALIKNVGPVSINVSNATLNEALRECLNGKLLLFAIDGKTITIVKGDPTSSTITAAHLVSVQMNVHGQVTDEEGIPLSGVTISINGTAFALTTVGSGTFSMSGVPERGLISFSCIGYETQQIKYDSHSNFNIRMKKRVTELGTVSVEVNNGYQMIPLERTTGSYDIIDNQLLSRSVSPNILDHLDDVASGVNFDNRVAGAVKSYEGQGNTQTFYIRGLSTINVGSSFPLVIVDGFPYNSGEPYLQNINNLNPNDIESMTVLKDAAAASIWGARAGNGVLVITTKGGKYNQRPQISFNEQVTVTGKPRLFTERILSTSDYVGLEQSIYTQGGYSNLLNPATANGQPVSEVVDLLNQVTTGTLSQADADAQIAALSKIDIRHDELKYLYQTGVDQLYNVNVRGGSPTDKYFISAGYDNGAAVDHSFQKRFTLTANNVFRPAANMEFGLPLTVTDNQLGTSMGSPSGVVGQLAPYTQLVNAAGQPQNVVYGGGYNQAFQQAALNNGLFDVAYNPINQLHAPQYDHTSSTLLQISPNLKYTLKSGWSAEVKYQYSKTVSNNSAYQSDSVWSIKNEINDYTQITAPGQLTYPINPGGILQFQDKQQVDNDTRTTLGYNHNIAPNHRLDAIAGYERNETTISGNTYGLYGYNPNTGSAQTTVDYVTYWPQTNSILAGSPYPYTAPVYPLNTSLLSQFVAVISYFGNAAYTYKGRYVLSGSARMDQANLFGVAANAKRKVLWSSGVAWKINDESFYHMGWLPLLKLRATYGFQGNLPNIIVRSQATLTYYPSTATSSGLPTALLNNPPNPNLTWEKIGQANVGLDFGTKRDVLTGTIEYYNKKGTNIVAGYPIDPTTGVSSLTGNVADLTGHGIDLTLVSKNFNGRHFKWSTRFLFSHNTDKLTKYLVTTTASSILQQQTGQSFPSNPSGVRGNAVYGIYSLRWGGLDAAGNPQGYDTLGKISEDYNQLTSYMPIKDLVYHGSGLPTYFGSFMNEFSYNDFTVSVNISYKMGYYFHAQSVYYSELMGYGNSPVLGVSDGSSDYDKRWQKPGDEKLTHVPSAPTLANQNFLRDEFYQSSSVLVQRGDNIRLKDVSLAYHFRSLTKGASPFSNVELDGYYLGNTLLWKANKLGIDPDFSTMRPAKSFSLGLRLALK